MRRSVILSFLRRVAIACVVVAVLTSAAVVGANTFEQKKFDSTKKLHIPGLDKAEPGKPANYLLIGSDTRTGLREGFGDVAGQRSDVMMVLHVEPQHQTGMLVSFPRDLMVDIPGHGRQKLNAAFGLGGPALAIATFEKTFYPLKIQHYIEVNFDGFKDIVDAIGGKIPLYFPTPAHDPESGLNIDTPGCVKVDGDTALAYARSRYYYIPASLQHPAWSWNYDPKLGQNADRGGHGWIHTGDDRDRIQRQQYFLRTLAQKALDKTSADPLKLNDVLNAVTNSFTHDDTLKLSELQALIRTFNKLNPAKVDMETLPTKINKNELVEDIEPAQSVISRLTTFNTAPPDPHYVDPHTINVRFVNGSGIKGVASRASDALATAGFNVSAKAEDADRDDYRATQIRYAPGTYDAALTVSLATGSLNMIPVLSRDNTLGADILVVVGSDYDALKHRIDEVPGVNKSATSSTTVAASNGSSANSSTTSVAAPSTTSTTQPLQYGFVPGNDSKTGEPLVGCPS